MNGARGQSIRRWPLVGLLLADTVSATGNRLALLAIPWFVLETTGDFTKTGIVAFTFFLPLVLSTFFGGPLVDRVGFVRSSVMSDMLSGTSVAAVPLLHHFDALTFPALVGLVFLGTVFDAPGATARTSMLPDVAELAHVSLERATGLREAVGRISQVLGGAVGGGLIALVGSVATLWVDAATFLVSAVVIASFQSRNSDAPSRALSLKNYLGDLRAGAGFLVGDSLLRAILTYFVVANMIENAVIAVLLPAYGNVVLESEAVTGAALAALGAGALVGTLSFAAFGERVRRVPLLLTCLLIAGPPKLIVLLFSPSVAVIVGVMAISGLAMGPVNPLLGAVEYERIPAALRGRVFGAFMATVLAGAPAGVLAAGLSLDALGFPTTFLVLTVMYGAASLLPFLSTNWRQIERSTKTAPASAAVSE